MRRLVTRLTLGMLALATLTTIIILFTVQLGLFLHFRSLPVDVRQALESQFDNPQASVFQEAFRGLRVVLRNASIVSIVLVVFVASVFARVAAKALAKPIEQVSRASMQVAQGDLEPVMNSRTKIGNDKTWLSK